MPGNFESFLSKAGEPNKQRWFVLRDNSLSFFKSPQDKSPLGTINLDKSKTENGTNPLLFTITTPSMQKPLALQAETQALRDNWVAALTGNAPSNSNGDEKMLLSCTGQAVSLKDFEILKVIGRGSFGKVMKAQYKATGQIFAMKALRKDQLLEQQMVQNAKDEKNILQSVDHPFIVKLHFAFQTKQRIYLVLDLLPGGELFFHLKNAEYFSETRSKLYAAEIASALEHLHSLGVIYRDLKPENVVLDAGGHAMLTDMGLAKTQMNPNVQTYTFCGTPEYIAPEILKGTGHNKGVDWWALGTLIFEMLTGLPPFYCDDVNEMYELILFKPLDFPDEIPPDARDLIGKLLIREPKDRLTDGNKVLSHVWFSDIDMDKMMKKQITPEFVPDLSGDDMKYIEDEIQGEQAKDKDDIDDGPAVGGEFQDFNSNDKHIPLLNSSPKTPQQKMPSPSSSSCALPPIKV
eukprot:NODE_1374_length_1985_cov_45.942535_g1163_i0.p1 GENE.NODE_1374_length_1985_cov_45.942535_g1163_i0~~NODE_1374_length_1985_cov_45.942535_g1163_i0.p1  ORF type:complete len:462 (-),score=71.81 NODE_1374_length_1985_cov_45.942535_g1163_i0:545-1930(-)